ncbi:MAG: diguanylate cyclase [Calothrix sp. SM1_5_4]|nr:diguanylate cyclase [Calothrix sp. SM1_5_4]
MKTKVLCVDDDNSILDALTRLLKAQFDVGTASCAREGLDWLKKNPDCAVVLSDFRMPGMNGVEFLREIRQNHPESVRAILSGQIDLQLVSEAINNSDIHKFFLKPWENDYLLVQMSEALNLHHTLREKAHYERLAVTDPVTQVSNHRFFQNQLRRELQARPQGPVSLLIFDVDDFKAYNDRYGHPEGDRLLYNVAQTLERLRPREGFVSRYGGEEFTMILPGLDLD